MASAGFAADFAKRPPAVKLGALVVVLLLLGLGYYQLVFKKLRQDLRDVESEAAALVQRERQIAKETKEYDTLRAELDKLEYVIAANERALPDAAQLDSFFGLILRKAKDAGLVVRRWDPAKEVAVDETIYKVPLDVELDGTFYQVKRFFYLLWMMNQTSDDEPSDGVTAEQIEDRDRILTVEDLRIVAPRVRTGDLEVTVSFRASTFRKEPVEEPAEDPKKKATGKAPDASQTGTPRRAVDDGTDASEAGAERVKGGM
jgi:hypothetical protein